MLGNLRGFVVSSGLRALLAWVLQCGKQATLNESGVPVFPVSFGSWPAGQLPPAEQAAYTRHAR